MESPFRFPVQDLGGENRSYAVAGRKSQPTRKPSTTYPSSHHMEETVDRFSNSQDENATTDNLTTMGNIVMQRRAESTHEGYIVLFGNLPWKARWQDLKDLVRKHTSSIERAEIYLTPDGRSRGFGYARVRGREEAMKVVANLDGYEWEARALMVKLGNEHDMCPTAGSNSPGVLPVANPPVAQPVVPWPVANSPIPEPPFVIEPELPPEYLDQTVMESMLHPGISPAEVAFYRQGIAAQAYLHYEARSVNHGYQAEHHRIQADTVRPWGGDHCPLVVEHQRAEQAHNEDRVRAQNQAFVAYLLSKGHVDAAYKRKKATKDKRQPSPLFQPPVYGPPPGVLMPASGFGYHPPIPGNEQFMVAINPYYSVIEPAPIFVTPDRGLPVNLTNGALITESRGVFVGNLAYDTQWQELKEFLDPAGHLERCDVPQTDGRGRGYATALFSSAEEAQRACSMFDQQFFKGRKVKVRLDKYTIRRQSNPAFIPPVSRTASGPLMITNVAPAHH
ncbi:hypothetical protein L873DRAFT_1795251 [Choiromyces venosus 120613-1]|uniref:RRM domain-containing protein n=1 Tax=Choiromyces venosus 120613-1 TaxID=1336337 RepID=A0A3N4J0U4_9PEZI|nr:hypothetical protein L873DRAFT_1795251 [Choiromyces venosus 120613-1]